ncbi:MAG: alpha/beta fold hydrolase [Deltaproteobacteria bacterium]|nr:alpha/beta fold hydrolase [Deltaproteobacteria bacterium]
MTNFYLAPRNSAEEKLERIWAKVFGLDRVGIHDDFFDLGGHSLLAFRLISEVELEFGKAIPVATLLECPSVAQLAGALPTLSETGGSPLIAVQTSGSKPPFFCAHGADSYARLARYLGPDQPFYGLAQHLVGSRVHHTSIEGIAAHYLKAVRTVQPVGPYYIGGHSIGGLIAFEMAQQLRRLDQLVGLLVLLDSGSPPRSSAIMAANRVRHFRWEYAFNKFDIRHLKKVSWLARRWLDETLRLKAKALTCNVYHYLGLPLSPELKDFYVDQVVYGKIYPDAHRRYAPRTYSGRAVYFKSEDARERVAGWQKLMTRGLEVRPVTGSHLTMLVEPHVKGLAEALRECLTEAPQQAILQRASRNTASTSFDQIWTAS